MDLASRNTAQLSEEGVWVKLYDPETFEEIEDVAIKVAGQDSKRYRSRESAVRAEQRNANRRDPVASAEDVDRDRERAVNLIVSCVMETRGLSLDDEPVELADIKQGVRILSDPGFAWIREQLDRHIHDRGNFMPATATTSSAGPRGGSANSPAGNSGPPPAGV